jgi:hypothetical protein
MASALGGVSLASGRTEIFELVLKFVLQFMPGWAQATVLALVVLAFAGRWILKLTRKVRYRRAVRAGVPVHAAAQYGQGRGADYLGAYAPRQDRLPPAPTPAPTPAGPSGADFLGACAPGQGPEQDVAH